MRGQIRIIALIMLCLFVAMAAGGCDRAPAHAASPTDMATPGDLLPEEPGEGEEPDDPYARRGQGIVRYNRGIVPMATSQEGLLKDYMHDYFMSLALYEIQEPSRLFTTEGWQEAQNNLYVWEATIGLRQLHPYDMRLSGYYFFLYCVDKQVQDNGDLRVAIVEDNVQNFNDYVDVNARSYNNYHVFTMRETQGGWRLLSHRQVDSFNNMLLGRWQSAGEDYELEDETVLSVEEFLERARAGRDERTTQGELAESEFDEEYDREEALEYAQKWVESRNPDWPVYDRLGGNCQNFVSQALLAGGIPMDTSSPGVWKYYGGGPDNTTKKQGRSASWSNVGSFLEYARNNTGKGLVAVVDAPYYTGEPGDIIHMGNDDGWKHTVMITNQMVTQDGEVVDYLVSSNTVDLQDYPVSLLHYTKHMLIRIYGWNK